MLEIATGYWIDPDDGDPVWVLQVDGKLRGECVRELRRSWLRLRDPGGATRIRIELDAIDFIDRAGRLLLAEMRDHGVEVRWTDSTSSRARSTGKDGARHTRW